MTAYTLLYPHSYSYHNNLHVGTWLKGYHVVLILQTPLSYIPGALLRCFALQITLK